MNFEQTLFISYAHIDDQPLDPGQKGWVTRFHGTLKAILSMRMGREVKIWRDDKLTGNDVFSSEIVAQFKQSAVLLSVITPRYLNSEWCTREAHEFCETAERTGGLVIGNKSRVFKVIKTPVDDEKADGLPAQMKDLLGFEFFAYKDGAPLELDPDYGPEYSQLYKQKVAVLAQDIAQLLKTSQTEGNESNDLEKRSEPPALNRPLVYLAECSYDRKRQRELIQGELKRLSYAVLPDRRLPTDESEYVAAVEALLARCALSIHLVGENYSAVPDGPTGKSVGILQNELAVARCKSGGLKRLIWLPQGTTSKNPVQRAVIEALPHDAQALFGADLIAGDIEELRTAVHATLRKIEQPEPKQRECGGADADAEPSAGESARRIYFICDERDRKASVPVRKLCKQLGLNVALPAFEGDASEVRKANQQNLADCDGVFVFYGAGDAAWKRAIDNELRKMAGYRGGKSRPPIFTYLAEPRTADKQDLIDMEEPGLIDGLDGLSERAMTELLQHMTEHPAAA
jgi:hypothetical protein